MKEIVVLSGKGGTGKTSIAGAFAVLAENKVLVDCDVDAADLHLILKPSVRETHEFWSGQVAIIDQKRCTRCGLCVERCRFEAISDFTIDQVSCEGCGFCARICPENAITMQKTMSGHWHRSDTDYGTLVHAELGVAQENSGKLVALIRKQARQIAETQKADLIISDGPPGIGCPVISSLSGASLALLVTEPTLSGMHDLERVLQLCQHFNVPTAVCINKYDINGENTRQIERFCDDENVKVVARVPFDAAVTEAIAHGVPVVVYSEGTASRDIRLLWHNVVMMLDGVQKDE